MTVNAPTSQSVSASFAFVLKEAEFADAVIFADPRPSELSPEETAAAERVSEQVLAEVQAFLECCREEILAESGGTLRDQLAKRKTQRSRIREDWWFELPIRGGKNQTDAALECGIFRSAENRYVFRVYLWARNAYWPQLQAVLSNRKTAQIKGDSDRSHLVGEWKLSEGDTFRAISRQIASDVVPWLTEFDRLISAG